MTPRVKVDLSGDVECVRLMKELPGRMVKSALRKAIRESAKIVLRGAKFRAPHRSGLLGRSLKVKAFKRTRKAVVGVTVGTAAGDYRGQTFYGSFQEFGWKATGPHRAGPTLRSAQRLLKKEKTNGAFVVRDGSQQAKAITSAKLTVAKDRRKQIKGKFYLRNAFTENNEAIQAELAKNIKAELQAAAIKGAKK